MSTESNRGEASVGQWSGPLDSSSECSEAERPFRVYLDGQIVEFSEADKITAETAGRVRELMKSGQA